MNELAEIVSDALIGNSFKTIELKGKFYTVYAPATIVVARMLSPLSKIYIDEKSNGLELISILGEQSKYIAQAIAIAVIGDKPYDLKTRFKKWIIERQVQRCTTTQQKKAFEDIISIIDVQSFFDLAQLAMKITNRMAKEKSPEETR